MQRLKLKRVKKKNDLPERRTVKTTDFMLNGQHFDLSIEITDKVFITNNTNGKIFQLVNEVT